MIAFRNPINHMTVGYKKSIILSVGGYPELFAAMNVYRRPITLWSGDAERPSSWIEYSDLFAKRDGDPIHLFYKPEAAHGRTAHYDPLVVS